MASGENTIRRSKAVRARRMARRASRPTERRGYSRRGVPAMVARSPRAEERLNLGRQAARRLQVLNLATEGAELRLPALPVIRIGWRAVSAVMVGLMAFVLYALLTSSAFTVSRVELRDVQRLDAQDVNSALRVAGASVFAIEPAEMAAVLAEAFPELENLSVHVGFPARVVVEATERRPVLAWEQSGITVWVDEGGVAFIPEGQTPFLVPVRALEPPPDLGGEGWARHQLIRPEMVTAILALHEHAPDGVTLLYDPKMGFGWEDPAGWEAYFGQSGEAIGERIAVYQAIVAELSSRRLVPTLISVAQVHAPYYRLDY